MRSTPYIWVSGTSVLTVLGAAICISAAAGHSGKRPAKSQVKPTPTPKTENIQALQTIQAYTKWRLVTPNPLYMASATDMLCRLPTQAEVQANIDNPHVRKFYTVFVNKIGQHAMLKQRKPHFPVGSIVVKRKFAEGDLKNPVLLTAMIKRGKGYNTGNGDWEYFVLNGNATKIEGRGKISRCQSCHVQKESTDFIYRGYLPQSIENKLR